MLTVNQCRDYLEKDAEGLKDEEIIEIRDWLSNMADILIESMEKLEAERKKKKDDEKKSNYLHTCINR